MTAVSFLVLQYAVVERVVGIPLLETLRDAVPALCAGLVLLATAWLGVELLDPALPGPARHAPAGDSSGLAAYALVLRVLFAATWRDLAALAASLRPRSG